MGTWRESNGGWRYVNNLVDRSPHVLSAAGSVEGEDM